MKKIFTLFSFLLFSLALQAQWVLQNSGFTTASRGIRAFSVVSPTVAWAVAYDGSGSNANVQDYTRTTNGGTTWTSGTITGTGITGFNNSNISALDANTAWVAMYGSAGGGRIYHTSNGGTTWTQQNTTGYTNAASFLNAVHFFDPLNGVSMGDPVGGWHEVYTTSNGGATWIRVPQTAMPAPLAADEYGIVDVYSAAGDTIWFGTINGRIFKSVNKGLNWTVSTTGFTGTTTNYAMDDLEFIDAYNGLVKDGTILRRTTDGGLTWTPVSSTGTVFTTDLGPVPGTPESYVSVGTTGSSYTQNAGNSWTTISTMQLNKVGFANPTTGWGGGFSQAGGTGGIYKWNGPTLLPTNDLSLSAINSPALNLCNASAALVCVVISNTGTIPQANFQISYQIGTNTPVTAMYTGTIAPGANGSYCFSPPASFPAPGTYTVTASVLLAGDADASNNQTVITVNSTASAPITIQPAGTVCSGQSVNLSASGATTYTWQPGGQTGAVISVSPTATTTYTVTGSNGTGCNSTGTTTVTVSAGPTLVTSATPATICAGQSAVLSATGAVSYSWMPGTLAGGVVTVSPTSTTTYSVTGTDANGCTATSSVAVNVSTGPVLTVTATPASVCPGEPVALSAAGGATYSWHNAGQTTATINLNPTTTTTYSVTGTDATGCTATGSALVTVTSAPVIGVTAAPATLCTGQSTVLSATGASSFSWYTAGQTTSSISVSPTSTTTYSVAGLTSSGCNGLGAITVTVNPIPVVSIVAPQTAICAGQSMVLTASGANFSYSWVPSGTGVPGSNLIITPTATTTYTVYGANSNGGCVGTNTFTVNVNPAPAAPVATSNSPICQGSSLQLSASGSAGLTYSWTGPGTFTSGIASPSILNAQPTPHSGPYTVVGIENGCASAPAIVNVVVGIQPTAPQVQSNSPICSGDTLNLTASGTYPPGATFSWTTPANTYTGQYVIVPNVTAANNGLVSVWVTSNGCISPAGQTPVLVNPAPSAAITPPTATGNSYTFSAATSGLASYSWSFPGGTPATASTQTATATFANAGTYTVSLTTTSTQGCSSTETFVLLISGTADAMANLVKVYPNPTSGTVQLDLSALASDRASVQVLNVLGQVTRTAEINTQSTYSLDLAGLAQGTYTICIQTPDGVMNKRIVLQR